MELSPFTIIYRSPNETGGEGQAGGTSAFAREGLRLLGDLDPQAAKLLKALNSNLARTLIDSSCELSSALLSPGVNFGEAVSQALRPILEELERARKVETVAVWDLDAHIGGLPRVVEHLNKAQSVFTFFLLQAPLPAGLVARRENFLDWARSRRGFGQRILKKHAEEFDNNLMSNDFYKHARVVHKTLGVDYTVGVTRHMVAGYYSNGELYWNHFAASSRPISLVSAYDMSEYAREAGRPFEVAVAGLIVAQLLMDANKKAGPSKLKYHDDTGCLFDYNQSRDSIVRSLREARIEPECLKKIATRYRKAAVALVEALKSYTPEEDEAEEAGGAGADAAGLKFDEKYWLEQLGKLSKPRKDQPT